MVADFNTLPAGFCTESGCLLDVKETAVHYTPAEKLAEKGKPGSLAQPILADGIEDVTDVTGSTQILLLLVIECHC